MTVLAKEAAAVVAVAAVVGSSDSACSDEEEFRIPAEEVAVLVAVLAIVPAVVVLASVAEACIPEERTDLGMKVVQEVAVHTAEVVVGNSAVVTDMVEVRTGSETVVAADYVQEPLRYHLSD